MIGMHGTSPARVLSRTVALALASALLLGSGGCLFGGHSKVKREGNYVAQTTLSRIKPGKTTQGWVRAVIGEPNEKIETDPGMSIWKYSYTETKDSGGYVFLIFHADDQKVNTGNVFIEFENGVVTRSWRG